MPRYEFVVVSSISLNFTVDAKDRRAAIEEAQSASIMGLCHQCARGEEGEWCTSGELDVDPSTGLLVEVLEDGESIIGALESKDWDGKIER